jgi:hypothetical protein
MIRKLLILFVITTFFATGGCIKETYDMNMLSKKGHLSPTVAISAVKGDISLSDIIETNDTVIFDENNLVKIVFKEDSVVDLTLENFYDLDEMFTYNEGYTLGELSINPFMETIGFTLDQISSLFDPALRAQFVALDGTTNPFPDFPLTDLGETSIPLASNFEYATFSEGSLDIIVTNNLTAPLYNVLVSLYNSAGHTPIGNEVTISGLDAGESGISSIDLADLTVTNSILASVILTGSEGTTDPVLIDLDNSNVEVVINGRDLVVKSGRVIVPEQTINSPGTKDTVTFDPGTDVEIDELGIVSGNINYSIQSSSSISVSLSITFPTGLRAGVPITEAITIDPFSTVNGTISVDNTTMDLGTDPLQPFNRVPLEQTITVSSNGSMVDFDSEDSFTIDIELLNPDFDYIKGYFGQEIHTGDVDTLDLNIKDILDNFRGDIFISNPSISLNYSNSFALPIEITLNATGYRKAETEDLGLDPFNTIYPDAPVERDVTESFRIDRDNSSLPELFSLPPEIIVYSGSGKTNPQGNTGERDNYIFDDSRFVGAFEVEVPMEMRFNNLQFTDTVDNFLQSEDTDDDNPIKPENFEFLRIDLTAENGFPLGVSVEMNLYDSLSNTIKSSVEAIDVLEPAPVDANGKVTSPVVTSTSIEFTQDFFSSINEADKIIFRFTMKSTDDGTKDVKIYSDYRLDFKAVFVMKPDININLD